MKHGTGRAYSVYGCRCDLCREAKVTENRKYRDPAKQADLARKHYENNKEDHLERSRNQRKYQKDKCRIWAANRRARVREAFVETVDHSVVFESVGYVCQGCGIDCDKEAVWPSPNFPSLDHVVPLSKGGEHSYSNVQLLCLKCNLEKSDKLFERSA